MDADLISRHDRPLPRYTSYPTAPHFHAGIGAAQYRAWLSRIVGTATVSLYFHVPFCRELCWYCGCHTRAIRRYRPLAAYAGFLASELVLVSEAIPTRPAVTHVHFGGGTPTMLSAADFTALMDAARDSFFFSPETEIAVEIDPRSLAEDMAAALADAGVTRASLGVQELSPVVQRAVNRVQPYEMVAATVERVRAAGITAINFDLMYGLPHQTVADVGRTVDLAAGLAPDRVAVFGYAHVPWMKAHQRLIEESALPKAKERMAQAEAAAERLLAHGYRRIGLDHFAKPGDPMTKALGQGRLRRNFQGYTTDRADVLLGFGASAIGCLGEGYAQNAVAPREYEAAIRQGDFATTRGIALNDDDRRRRAVIERLMCGLGVDLDEVRTSGDDFTAELARLAAMEKDGLVEIEGARLRVTERGRPFTRAVAAVFDRYLGGGRGRHSQAV